MIEINWQNLKLSLHHSGAIFIEKHSLLLISDVHLGKVTHFRKHGAAVPQNAIFQNFKNMDEVIETFNPFQICFMGDLFHSDKNREFDLFSNWIAGVPSQFYLVRGNHDSISDEIYQKLGIETQLDFELENDLFLFHHPQEKDINHICGHVHPAALMKGKGGQKLRLPCFCVSQHQIIMPAFGTFTGKFTISVENFEHIYLIAGESVVLV